MSLQKAYDETMKRLFPNGGTALLAVSGGIDSMTLATLASRSEAGLDYAVAHCNFHLRGDESDADEALVRSWCDSHGMPFHKVDFDTKGVAASTGESIEMVARSLRYAWFDGLCKVNGYVALVVAHNANDNAETMVLNLLRGTGIRGLSGMRETSPIPLGDEARAEKSGVPLVRPLLGFPRSEIASYAAAERVEYREDRTNSSVEIPRNRIRNQIFPLFEKINPSFLACMARTAGNLRQVGAVADEYLSAAKGRVLRRATKDDAVAVLSVPDLLCEPHMDLLLHSMLSPYGFTPGVVADIAALLSSGGTVSGRRFASPSMEAVTTTSEILIRPLRLSVQADDMITIYGTGSYSLYGVRLDVSVRNYLEGEPLRQPDGMTMLDAARVPFPLTVRRWREGDWMRPLGMRGCKKKLSDMLVDLHIPLHEKSSAVVLQDASEETHVLALIGRRIDESVRVSLGKTRRVIVIRLHV